MRYAIGIDGGGTKTVGVLGSDEGEILKRVKMGASAPRNLRVEESVRVLKEVISQLSEVEKPDHVFIGLAGVEEQPELGRRTKKRLAEELSLLEGKFEVGSDQIAALRAGTEGDGLLIIAGTGAVAHAWNKRKESKVSGWGYLEDRGSAYWAGRRAFQAVVSACDGRGPETKIKEEAFKDMSVEGVGEFLDKVYEKPFYFIPRLSLYCDLSAQKGDEPAQRIMKEAGEELAESGLVAVERSGLEGKFPVVLVGSMFKSAVLTKRVKESIKKQYSEVEFVRPEKEPAEGALRIALSRL